MKKFMLFNLWFTIAAASHAVSISSVSYGGNGCPAESLQTTIKDDGTVVLEPKAFDVSIPSSRFDRKACDVAIALDVPEGQAVAFSKASMIGTVELQAQMSMVLTAETFFAGQRGPTFTQSIAGRSSTRFNKEMTPPVAWSKCGESVILRLNSAVVLQSKTTSNDNAGVAVNKITIERPFTKKCTGI